MNRCKNMKSELIESEKGFLLEYSWFLARWAIFSFSSAAFLKSM